MVRQGGCTGWVWYRGRVYGWVAGWAIPGTYPPSWLLEEGSPVQRSGPRKALQGPGVGGTGLDGRTGGGDGNDHPAGPVGAPLVPLPVITLEMPPPGLYGEIRPPFPET